MKYPSPSEFKNNFSEEALDQMAKQARATVEIHRDWTEEMKDSFAKSTYQFFGYRALFQKYAKKAKELENNGGGNQKEFQQLEQQYRALQNEYHTIRSQFDNFKLKFDNIQIENMRLNAQVSDLQEQLEDAQTVPLENNRSTELSALQQEIQNLRQQNAALQEQLSSANTTLPSEANQLLKDLAEALQKQQQYSSEIAFLELEKNCLSEFISTIHPEEEAFELASIQERFSENHRKISDLQEKLQQTEEQIETINQTLQEDFM